MDDKEKELFELTADVDTEVETASLESLSDSADEKIEDNSNETMAVPFEETQQNAKRKPLIQTPILIAGLCFLVTALIVIGTILIYTALNKPNLIIKDGKDGTVYAWRVMEYAGQDYSDQQIFAQFAKDDNVYFYENGIKFYGKYTTEENDEGKNVLKSDFYIFGRSGGEGVISDDSNKENMTITFSDDIVLKLKKQELPKITLDPNTMNYASADEVGLTELNVDEKILGTWTELMDEYYIAMGYSPRKYVFNSDGTGSIGYDYTYNETYGYGYGMELGFKYTVKDNVIYVYAEFFDGKTDEMTLEYGINGSTLVLAGVGFEKSE